MEQLAYTLSELAEAARVGESSLRKKIAAGEGPAVTKFGRRNLVLVSDAKAWLQKLKEKIAA